MVEKWRRLLALVLCCGLLVVAPGMAEEMETMLSRGQEYEAAGEYQKAFASYELAIRIAPDAEAPYLAIARLHLTLGEAEEALQATDRLLFSAPTSGKAWLLQMEIHLQLEDPAEAESDALYAEVCGEEIPSALLAELGELWLQKSDAAKAVAAFERAELDLLDEEQREAYQKALVSTGNQEKAQELSRMQSGQRDTVLDAAFERGTPRLTEISLWPGELSGYEVGVSTAFWEAQPQEAKEQFSAVRQGGEDGLIYVSVPDEDMRYFRENAAPVSISPDGGVTLFRLDDQLFALRGKTLITLSKAENRGAADEYSKLDFYINKYLGRLPGEEGTVWSPDGRYAVMTSYRATMMNMQLLDPVILDTWRGEIFLAATYPRKIFDGGSGTVQARFDRSGRYLYYTLYGKTYEESVALMRYDLETGENILCCNDAERIAWPGLWELADGRWINLKCTTGADDAYNGLNVYTPADGEWTNVPRDFSASGNTVYPVSLQYSDLSGEALVLARLWNLEGRCMVRVRPGADFEGMDAYWAIEDLNGPAAARIDPAAFAVEDRETLAAQLQQDYAEIRYLRLSPDGNYALIYAVQNYTCAFLLLRLSDMALCQVDVPEELLTNAVMSVRSKDVFSPGIAWHEDGRLLILGRNGVKAYRLQ